LLLGRGVYLFIPPVLSLLPNIKLAILHILIILTVMTSFIDIATITSCLLQFLPQVIFVVLDSLFTIPICRAFAVQLVELGLKRSFIKSGKLLDRKMKYVLLEKGGVLQKGKHESLS